MSPVDTAIEYVQAEQKALAYFGGVGTYATIAATDLVERFSVIRAFYDRIGATEDDPNSLFCMALLNINGGDMSKAEPKLLAEFGRPSRRRYGKRGGLLSPLASSLGSRNGYSGNWDKAEEDLVFWRKFADQIIQDYGQLLVGGHQSAGGILFIGGVDSGHFGIAGHMFAGFRSEASGQSSAQLVFVPISNKPDDREKIALYPDFLHMITARAAGYVIPHDMRSPATKQAAWTYRHQDRCLVNAAAALTTLNLHYPGQPPFHDVLNAIGERRKKNIFGIAVATAPLTPAYQEPAEMPPVPLPEPAPPAPPEPEPEWQQGVLEVYGDNSRLERRGYYADDLYHVGADGTLLHRLIDWQAWEPMYTKPGGVKGLFWKAPAMPVEIPDEELYGQPLPPPPAPPPPAPRQGRLETYHDGTMRIRRGEQILHVNPDGEILHELVNDEWVQIYRQTPQFVLKQTVDKIVDAIVYARTQKMAMTIDAEFDSATQFMAIVAAGLVSSLYGDFAMQVASQVQTRLSQLDPMLFRKVNVYMSAYPGVGDPLNQSPYQLDVYLIGALKEPINAITEIVQLAELESDEYSS